MADDSDVEIDVDDVCGNMAAGGVGVEVQTIIQGQAPLAGAADELDFMVQEEVETTTEGSLTVELDPVDNVIIALQNNDAGYTRQRQTAGGHGRGHFVDEYNGCEGEELVVGSAGARPGDGCFEPSGGIAGKKRKAGGKSKAPAAAAKKKGKKPKRHAVRFGNRQIPGAMAAASVAMKEAKEANEVSFDPEKRPRKWRKRHVPVKTLDGRFEVSMWSAGMPRAADNLGLVTIGCCTGNVTTKKKRSLQHYVKNTYSTIFG